MFADLLPVPLHPAIVHLPIALAVLLPLFAIGGLIAVNRGASPRSAWGITVALAAALVATGLIAKETGEDGEDQVERIVPKAAFEAHEEAADRFVVIGLSVFALSLLGLRRDAIGNAGRIVATVGTVAVLAAGYSVGHAGGQLVYQHGAASAYTQGAGGSAPSGAGEAEERE
jgi:uncharacterized membrane protein